MPQQLKPHRRRFYQYSLRTLLILTALVAILLFVAQWHLAPYREQQVTMALVNELGGSYQREADSTWLRFRFLLGYQPQNVVIVNLADYDNIEAYLERVARLPRLETLAVGGEAFTDEHLHRLREVKTLRGLVLDCTNVTDAAIEELRQERPDMEIYKSQRRALKPFKRFGAARMRLNTSHAETLQRLGAEFFAEYDGKFTFEVGWDENTVEAVLERLRQLRHLPAVRALLLNDGVINDTVLEHLQVIAPQIQVLTLVDTHVSDAALRHLASFANLSHLRLYGNSSVGDTGLAHLKSLPNLFGLTLSRMNITDAGLTHLEGLEHLHYLDLDFTKVTDTGLAKLRPHTRLKWLSLKGTSVTDDGLILLKDHTNLTNLYLIDDTRITDGGMARLRGFTRVFQLSLAKTKVSDAGLQHLKGLTRLSHLHLSSTEITDAGLMHLKSLTALRQLDLKNTRISESGIKELRAALPECSIQAP